MLSVCWDSARLRLQQRCKEAEAAGPGRITKWVRESQRERVRERERDDWWGKDSHHPAWAPQWSVEAAVACWGQVCGAVELEQYPCTGGPDLNQPRNVEEEALGTMCSVPMPFWVPPTSALFCFQAGENRKSSGLGPWSQSPFCSQLGGLVSTQSAQPYYSCVYCSGISELLLHHLMSVNSSRAMAGKLNIQNNVALPSNGTHCHTIKPAIMPSCAGLLSVTWSYEAIKLHFCLFVCDCLGGTYMHNIIGVNMVLPT